MVVWIFFYFQGDIDNWTTTPDTPSYAGKNFWSNPWGHIRTPGLAMYWTLIGATDELGEAVKKYPISEDLNKHGKSNEKINTLGKKLVVGNIILLCISFAFLYFALSTIINPVVALFFILASIHFGSLTSPKYILADLPACAMTVIFVAFGILYAKYKQYIFLFLLCGSAIIACLIKPAMFFLSFIAGCIVLYEFISSARARNLKMLLITSCAGLVLVSGTLLWPFLLYTHSGVFFPSQLSIITKAQQATYLLQEGDDQLFTDPRKKAFVSELIKHKPEIDAEIDKSIYKNTRNMHSKAHIYMYSLNPYGYNYFFNIMNQSGFKLPQIERARLVKEVTDPIIRKHFKEYSMTKIRSFLSAFGYYKDVWHSIKWRQSVGQKLFPVFLLCYAFLFCAIAFGAKKLRYPLLLLALIHVMAVAFTAIGHAVLMRYLEITEWSFILALEVALYSLVLRLASLVRNRRPA